MQQACGGGVGARAVKRGQRRPQEGPAEHAVAARGRRAEDLVRARLERAAAEAAAAERAADSALQQLAAAERLALAVALLLGQQLRGGVGLG